MYSSGVKFLDYEKISDDLIYFRNNIVLRFNVSLANKNKDGLRESFHKEYKYSSKYSNKDKVITLRRSFDYFLSLDIKDNYENNIIIKEKDIMIMRVRFNEIMQWFNSLFTVKNNTLIISGKYYPIKISGLGYGKCLSFEPCIVSYKDGTVKEGIKMILDNTIETEFDIDVFMQFFYIISSINMYQSASTMLAYMEPDFGKNIITFEDSYRTNPNLYDNDDIPDGEIKKEKPLSSSIKEKSFFEKMDEL